MRSWEERLRLILAIIEKDLRIPLWAWFLAFFVAAGGFLVTFPGARFSAEFRWFESNLRTFYAFSTMLTSLTLGLTFASFHSGEIRRGTMRSIVLYPVDANDITIAKLLASLIFSAILSSIVFFGFFGGFFLVGGWPAADFIAIHLTTLAASFLALAVGVFLAQAIALVAGRMVLSPTALGAIFLFLAVVFTETALNVIGSQIVYSMTPPGTRVSTETLQAVAEAARGLSIFSPHHVGARILGIAFGLTRMWADFHLVAPVAASVLVGGYWFGKRLYLDVLIR